MQHKRNVGLCIIILVVASLACNFPWLSEIPSDCDSANLSQNLDRLRECARLEAEATRFSAAATADMGIRLTDVADSSIKLLTHGFLNLDVPNASSPNILGGGCWPPQYPNAATGYLKVDPAGVLDGKCNYGGVGKNEASGVLSGQIDRQAGTVTFHLTVTYFILSSDGGGRVTEDYMVDGKGTMAALGPGEVTGGSGAIAHGSAVFTWTCVAAGTGIACGGKPPNYDLTAGGTGTVPFTMTFYSEDGH